MKSDIEVFKVEAGEFVHAYTNSDGSWQQDSMTEALGPYSEEDFADGDEWLSEVNEAARAREGWYHWVCLPGCLPESEAIGPFTSRDDAWVDACDWHEIPISIEISSEWELFNEDGNCAPDVDYWQRGAWFATVIVYCHDKARAESDQTIDGSGWECPRDMDTAYAVLTISGAAGEDPCDAFDALVASLKAGGYDVSVD